MVMTTLSAAHRLPRMPQCACAALCLVAVSVVAATADKVKAPPFEGSVFKMEISANSLALVVDVSGSMHPFLSAINHELKRQLPRNPALHVEGTAVEKPKPNTRIENGVAPETITAIESLATVTTATTILWITDFKDAPNVDGMRHLKEVLEEHGLVLHLVSVGNRPPPSIQRIIESREGYWLVVDPETLR